MKGAYVLVIKVDEPVDVQLQSLGEVTFQTGTWIYVGSAMGNGSTSLENRINRHFRSEKTVYWHIDHLLESNVTLLKAFWAHSPVHVECRIAQEFEMSKEFQVGPRRFGSSDCKSNCKAHVFRFTHDSGIDIIMASVFEKLGLNPSMTTDGVL